MNAPSLYLYRKELYNEWKDSDDCVTLEFEMWLIDRLVKSSNEIQSLKLQLEALKGFVKFPIPPMTAQDIEYIEKCEPPKSIFDRWKECKD